jgi:hypothetical protein
MKFIRKPALTMMVAVLALTLIVPASYIGASSDTKTEDFVNGAVIGKNDKNIRESKSSSIAKLKKLSISEENGEINVQGDVKYNKIRYNISLQGLIFPMYEDNGFSDQLLYGDLAINTGMNDFNFLQFKVEKSPKENQLIGANRNKNDKVFITLVLEHKDTREVLVLQDSIKEDVFLTLLETSKDNAESLSEEELFKKISELVRAPREKRESLPELKETYSDSGSSEYSDDGDFSTMATSISYINRKELRRLISDLEAAGNNTWLDLSGYDLPNELFSVEGDKTNVDGINRLYAHGVSDYTGAVLNGISTVDVFADHVSSPYGSRIQHKVIDSITVLYDPYDDTVQLYQKDRGIKFHDIDLGVGKLDGKNVFNAQTANGLLNKSPDYIKALMARIPYLKEVSGVFYDLNVERNLVLGQTEFYPSTFEKQREAYDDDVIRNVTAYSEALYITRPGDFFNLHGGVSDGGSGYTWSWEWRFNYSPNF